MKGKKEIIYKRINIWSSPRNISTAVMYSFAQRPDAIVVDEPLYAHYLRHQPTNADHPGKAEILASQQNDGALVIKEMLLGNYGRKMVIFKQMTHHLVALDRAFIGQMENILLIRDPRAILNSFNKVIEEVTAEDIGIPQQYRLFQELRAAGRLTAVIDARRLLKNPAGVLRQLCDKLGIPFTEAMLSWPAGARPEDGVWAPYWYANVHRSTGFQPWTEKEITLPTHLESIANACRQPYEEMLAEAIR